MIRNPGTAAVDLSRYYLTDATFDEQVAGVAGCRYFVGVGSSWSNVATLFHKPQIHVSYTADLAQFTNPRMFKLVEPTLPQLQRMVNSIWRSLAQIVLDDFDELNELLVDIYGKGNAKA